MLTKLSKQLSDFGLSQNEIAVYVSLLQTGSETASNLAKAAKLNRSTTYVQLTSLMNYGLVSSFKKQKKTFFSPESPHNIKHLIESKIKELEHERDNVETLLPDLNELYSSLGEKPDVKTFDGASGLKTMRNEVINSGAEEFYVLYNADELQRIFSPEELVDFSERRAKANITSNILYNKKGGPFSRIDPPQRMIQVDPQKYPFSADIYVYKDTVSMASTSGKIIGVTIKNKQIADSLLTLFKLAYTSKDYKHKTENMGNIDGE